ncbi:MAG: YqcC family protein [Cellvibrionaceae bacterium]|nr:YqcC family protein [Cellvibrionaceae bacterium]
MNRYEAVAAALLQLQQVLQQQGLWQQQAPSAEALASSQPFCIDTLDFHQWLQFIFLPRMGELVQARAQLPPRCGIAPMVAEVYRAKPEIIAALEPLLLQLDELLECAGE